MANKISPKTSSPARSLVQMSEWDQPDWFTRWDVAAPTDRTSGNGLGTLGDAPAVNDGGRGFGPPNQPGSTGDPSEGSPLAQRESFNYPDVSREARVSGNPKMTNSDSSPGPAGYPSALNGPSGGGAFEAEFARAARAPWNGPKGRGEK